MGRILRFRRRGQIPQFEEALARLTEEITLTQSYADAMIRSGQYRAAFAVVDEQRDRLVHAQEQMLAAMRPRHRRGRVAAAGLAAAMLVGSASFAALSSRNDAPSAPSAPAVLERVENRLAEAALVDDERRASTIVAEALADLISIGPELSRDPEIQQQVESMLRKQIDRLTERRSGTALIAQLNAAVEKVKAEVSEPDPPPPAPEPKPQTDEAPAP
ncbi:MAG TPA: hypothetical protein VM841_02820 [Actinomycetota bacterium]|nr:hypothetical protein [Actinomycetota bacterium]